MTYLLYFGHVNIDIVLKVKDFGSVGESRKVEDYEERIGGTAYNAYKSLKSLDVPSKIFSVVGPEIEKLNLEGIFVKGDKNPTCWIVTNGREQMAYVYQGLWTKLHSMNLKIPIENFTWLHFSTGNPEFYLKIAKKAKEKNKKISFDPSQEIHYIYTPELFKKMLSYADLFFCNEKEYKKAKELGGDLLFSKKIIKTEGSMGASFYDPESGWYHIPGKKVELVDTLGAGDSFRAGFYAALYRGYDIISSIKIGNLVASKVVSSKDSYYAGSWEDVDLRGKKI